MRPVLIIACGALAREIAALRRNNRWDGVDVRCLPAELHNTPQLIPDLVRDEIAGARSKYSRVFVAYGDCGTGGRLDAVLAAEGVERLGGAHCYEFLASSETFRTLSESEPGTFYLTDFLVRNYARLVVPTLGLDTHPELAAEYFRNYRRVVYLSQTPSDVLAARARQIAAMLGLEFEMRRTGLGALARAIPAWVKQGSAAPAWQ